MKTAIEELFDEHFKHTPFYRGEIIAFAELYASQSKWISVGERLPKIGEEVLCYAEHFDIILCFRHKDYWCGSMNTRDAMTDGYCDNSKINVEITHWQPLPLIPTK